VKIDFSANLTAQFYTSQSTMDLCNSAEYATAMAQAALNDGLDPVAYAMSVSNATDKYSALFSLGYKKKNGIPISSCCFLFILFVVYHFFA